MSKDEDPGGGAFGLFLRPHPGAFRQLMCPHPREFVHLKKMLLPGEGEKAWALLELADAGCGQNLGSGPWASPWATLWATLF